MTHDEMDALLTQLSGLENAIEQGQNAVAADMLAGFRLRLLELSNQKAVSGFVDPTPFLDEMAAAIGSGSMQSGNFSATEIPLESCVGYGWYERQTDASGRCYYWCGGAKEATLSFSGNLDTLRGLALEIRPIQADSFEIANVEAKLDGAPVSARLVRLKRKVFLILAPSSARRSSLALLSLFPVNSVRPFDVGLSSDKRALAFNVVRVLRFDLTVVCPRSSARGHLP